jgi:hypothetical protein
MVVGWRSMNDLLMIIEAIRVEYEYLIRFNYIVYAKLWPTYKPIISGATIARSQFAINSIKLKNG